jgi:hypothetical protein
MITETPQLDVDERFFYLYEERFAPLQAVRTPTTPEEMVVGEVADSPGWVYWRLYPWRPREDVLLPIERQIGLSFPVSFKSLFTGFRTLSLDLGFVRFPEAPLRHELDRLRYLLLEHEHTPRAVASALLPFAWDGRGDYGLLCFDRRPSLSNAETAIVCFRTFDRSFEIEPVASSFSGYRDACTYFLEDKTDFLGLGEEIVATEEERRRSVEHFLDFDPSGMAAAGRAYWLKMAKMRVER